MNRIKKQDFIRIVEESEAFHINIENMDYDRDLETKLYLQQQGGNYCVEDKIHTVKIRGAAQKIFGNKVKANYGYKCAISDIKLKDFLVASHIVPWAKDKDNRLNPKNGICLSSLLDRAFDQGYISFSDELKLMISDTAKIDKQLFNLLLPYKNKVLDVPARYAPEIKFLEWHRKNIFKGL